nr:putative F-box/LRR-repeat protein 23 [Setaria viridis]
MDQYPIPLPKSPVRDWSQLPLDPLSSIFMKLGAIEILMSAGLVCRSWLAAARTPELWRFVDMTRHKLVFLKNVGTMCAMAKVAIDRSGGRMESFWAQQFVTSELLDYIASRANSLKSIRLIACLYISDTSLVRVAEKCPLLEEIECSYHARPAEFYGYVGNVRPQLKRLRIHVEKGYDSDEIEREMEEERRQQLGSDEEDEDEETEEESFEAWEARKNKDAFAIAESLHELRLLQMAGNSLTNKGLYAILDGCPHLECLDISSCSNLPLDNKLRARCARLKHVWLPGQLNRVRCPDLHVIREHEGEDYSNIVRSLSEDEDMHLCAEGETDDGSYGGNYWQDYSSSPPSSPDESSGPELSKVTCDDTRFYTDIHEYYSL